MNMKTILYTVLFVSLLIPPASASAQAWKIEKIACQLLPKSNNDIRCAFKLEGWSPVATIALCNKPPANYTTTFTYSEFHSKCGHSSQAIVVKDGLKVEKGTCIGIPMLSNDKNSINCLEGFISKCYKDGGSNPEPCGSLLNMSLGLGRGNQL